MKKDKHNLKFSLALLEKEPSTIFGVLSKEFLELEDCAFYEIASPISYELTARMITGSVVVSGKGSYAVKGQCGRCLCEIEQAINIDDISIFYDEVKADLEELNIADDLRAELILSLPVNILCSPDCAGLCPGCGANLNTEVCRCVESEESTAEVADAEDSPWGALENLKL